MLSEETIKEACEDFIKAALNLLNRSLAKGEPLTYTTIEDAEFQDGHFTKLFYRSELKFESLVEKHKDRIKGLTEFSRCVELGKTMDVENFDGELLTLLVRIIKKREDFGFDQRVFDSIYSILKDYLFSSEFIFRITAPLNSGCNIKDMDLGDGLKIRSITDEELQELWRRSRFGVISRLDIPFFKHTLELEYTISKNSSIWWTHQEKAKECLNDLITALRLFKRGGVSFNTYRLYPKGWASRTNSVFWESHMGLSRTSYGGGHYVLGGEPEIEQFQEFWRTFREIDFQSNPFLKMAISRFNFAYEKKNPEDKLVDYMISFESLFMKETQELSHRLSARISRFIKDDYDERKKLYLDFKKIYGIRSKIVHGESISPKSLKQVKVESIHGLIQKTDELLRESIKEFIDVVNRDAEYKHEEFLDKLDLDKL